MPQSRRIRLTVVLTHPVQYFAPWFRALARDPALSLSVIYGTEPTPQQQGAGFDTSFTWDVPLTDGYDVTVLHPPAPTTNVSATALYGVRAEGIEQALADKAPDVVLLMGWHAILQLRALVWCKRCGVPVMYRGDNTMSAGPAGWRRPLWRLKSRALLSLFNAHLSVGLRSRDYLIRSGVRPLGIFASPHFVDNAAFAAQAARYADPAERRARRIAVGLPPDAHVLLFAGKMYDRKRPMDVVEAAARLGPDIALLFVGGGPLEASVRAAAQALGIPAVFAGFINQSELGAWYALGDCLLLVSDPGETWGLVVNEAMACGLPAVVSTRVGASDDLVVHGHTGVVVPGRSPAAIADAVRLLREAKAQGVDMAADCRAHVARYSMTEATIGLTAACRRLVPDRVGERRVLALFSQMSMLGGLERMAMEVVRTIRADGDAVHAMLNTWAEPAGPEQQHPIREAVKRLGASWSPSRTREPLRRRPRVGQALRLAWDLAITNWQGWRAAQGLRPTHVLAGDYGSIVRHAPLLWWLRRRGARVVHRVANAVPPGAAYQWLWRRVVGPLTDEHWPNSQAVAQSIREALGVEPPMRMIPNHLYQAVPTHLPPPIAGRFVFVGQLIPEKGLDLLLDAVAMLRAEGRAVTLDVVGRTDGWQSPTYGSYRDDCLARGAAADLAGAVRWLGTRGDVPACLAAGALHVCPSRPEMLEGMPAVVIEAKAVGTPSVAFAHGPFPEMIDPGVTGWMTPDISSVALAQVLREALDDVTLLDARRAVVRASVEPYRVTAFEHAIRDALANPLPGIR